MVHSGNQTSMQLHLCPWVGPEVMNRRGFQDCKPDCSCLWLCTRTGVLGKQSSKLEANSRRSKSVGVS